MRKYTIIAILATMLLSGCALVNPYKEGFECPGYDKGKCTSVKNAYKEDISSPVAKTDGSKTTDGAGAAETDYQKEVYGKLSALLKAPKTPMVAPPKVMRIMFLPYKGDNNELFMTRYAYFMVDEPKWIMGEYLTDDGTEGEK